MPRRRFGQGRSEFYGDTFVLAEVSKSIFEKFEPVGGREITGQEASRGRDRHVSFIMVVSTYVENVLIEGK